MTQNEVYADLGMVQLGDCCCDEPLIGDDGKQMWAASGGQYSTDAPACENWKGKAGSQHKTCGCCIYWEATNEWE